MSEQVVPMRRLMAREQFTLEDGRAITVDYPTSMTSEDLRDIREWLPIMLRKFERAAQVSAEPEAKMIGGGE